MNKLFYFSSFIVVVLFSAGCSSLNKTKKGAAIGTATGTAMGAVIGKVSGNTALGAIIGAAVGGTTGAIIGNKMDMQAEEIAKKVPDAEVIRVGEGIVVEFNSNILFAFDKYAISKSATKSLNELGEILKEYPDTNIEIQGHTDSKGSVSYNQNLSEQRATTVSLYLLDQGITANRLTINGFGELLPKYINTTVAGREKNRRVEFLITANEKMKSEAANQSK